MQKTFEKYANFLFKTSRQRLQIEQQLMPLGIRHGGSTFALFSKLLETILACPWPPPWRCRSEKSGHFGDLKRVPGQLCSLRMSGHKFGSHLDAFCRVPIPSASFLKEFFSSWESVYIYIYTYQTCVQEGLLRICTNFTAFSVVQCCSVLFQRRDCFSF